MTVLKKPTSLTIAEYLAGEELSDVKHEYLGGTVHAMAGASNQHNAIAVNALGFLLAKLRGKSCRPFNSDTKVRIEYPDHTRFYYPDALVVCHSNPSADHFQDRPVVIIEVLSDSTRRTDLGEKRDAYLTIPSLKVLIFENRKLPPSSYTAASRRAASRWRLTRGSTPSSRCRKSMPASRSPSFTSRWGLPEPDVA